MVVVILVKMTFYFAASQVTLVAAMRLVRYCEFQ